MPVKNDNSSASNNNSRHGQIIVLGMHRSGTSCVGNLLTKLGVYFGDGNISTGAGKENPKGFFERRDVREICDDILQGSGADWWAVNHFSPERVPAEIRAEVAQKFGRILDEMKSHRPWFIKEPRLCLVWPLLSAQVVDPVFIHVWRDPIEVARSLNVRNGFSIDFGIALWEAYILAAHAAARGQPSLTISYNELLKAPEVETQRLVKRLGELGIQGIAMPSEQELHDAVDVRLHRNQETSSELEELLAPSHRSLIAALREGGSSDPALHQPLSAPSRLRLDDWTSREGVFIALRRAASEGKRVDRLKAEQIAAVRDQEAQISALQLQIRGAEETIAALQSDLRRNDRYIEQIRGQFYNLRDSVARQVAQMIDKSELDSVADATRAIALLRRVNSRKILSGEPGEKASANKFEAPILGALYMHYRFLRLRADAAELVLMANSGLFDPAYYLLRYDDVAKSGVDPLLHFMDFGGAEHRNPSRFFDTEYYLRANPDVAASKMNPLLHFITSGRREGRAPRPVQAPMANFGNWILPEAPVPLVPRDSLRPKVKRAVIYTAVAAGYDNLKPPGLPLPGCDFVVFSDQNLKIEGWQVRPLNYLHPDPTRSARFVKTHPHIYFPEYDHSIWIDANIGIRGDVRRFFDSLTYDSPIGIFIHPLRDCIYVEGAECIKRKKDTPEDINRHLDRYRAENIPEKIGLWETNVVVRRHNDPSCIALMDAWWREMEIGSRRDQLSLPVVARRLAMTISPLGEPGANARQHELVTLEKHPSERVATAEAGMPAPALKDVDIGEISIDIGVCVHNCPTETRACLNSLIAQLRPQDRIIVVDDASDAPTATIVRQAAKERPNVTLIRHDKNLGYTASANAVMKEAKGDWIVLVNSDTVVPARALLKMVTCGEQFANIGVVGPLSNAASWQTVPQMTGADGRFLVNTIPPALNVEDMDRICEELSNRVPLFVSLINGFCFAIRRTLLQQIGMFDQVSFPMGYGEEDDFCLRAGAAGYVCAIASDAYVYHQKSASFTPERRSPLVEAGARALRAKHTAERINAATAMLRRHPELTRIRERVAGRLQAMSPQMAQNL